MIRALIVFLIGITISEPTIPMLSVEEATTLFHQLNFAMTSYNPGAAIAFRLAPRTRDTKILVCFRSHCFQALRRWQLLATNPQIPGRQLIAIVDEKMAWTFRKIHLDSDLWEKTHQKIAQLRLPASIMQEIENRSDLIHLNNLEDQHLYSQFVERPWSSQWSRPMGSLVTSEFGSMRVPPHGAPYAHTGVDFRAAVGSLVRATSDGIIAGTDNEVIYGNVITIDHGYGLITRYMHLSAFNVSVGDRVKAGDIIGLSGATGRVEAPHLHWEMRIRGQPVDPVSTQLLLARLSDLE